MMRALWGGLLLLATLSGCSAPKACHTDSDGLGPGEALSATAQGSVELDASLEPGEVNLVAALTSLPRLWQAGSNLLGGHLQLEFALSYVDENLASGSGIEMPRVTTTVRVGSVQSPAQPTTSSFPNGGGSGGRHELFHTCSDPGDPGCCEYGAQTCSLPVLLRFERLDGAPFPSLRLAWQAEAGVEVSPCPLESEVTAELSLEPVAP